MKPLTTLSPDFSQLQLTNDVVACTRCKSNYKVSVATEIKNVSTKCTWCEHVQVYRPSKMKLEN
jgi:hypothetical protein